MKRHTFHPSGESIRSAILLSVDRQFNEQILICKGLLRFPELVGVWPGAAKYYVSMLDENLVIK